MGSLAASQVVLVHFPFSDLTASKLRPAVVLAAAGRGDWILSQITSKSYGDSGAIDRSREARSPSQTPIHDSAPLFAPFALKGRCPVFPF
jgi:hypothetical protein